MHGAAYGRPMRSPIDIIALLAYWGHELDFSWSCDDIGHLTIRYHIGYFLLVILWNGVSISSRF